MFKYPPRSLSSSNHQSSSIFVPCCTASKSKQPAKHEREHRTRPSIATCSPPLPVRGPARVHPLPCACATGSSGGHRATQLRAHGPRRLPQAPAGPAVSLLPERRRAALAAEVAAVDAHALQGELAAARRCRGGGRRRGAAGRGGRQRGGAREAGEVERAREAAMQAWLASTVREPSSGGCG